MRNIILMAGISLDGFIEGPGRDISWHRVDDELHQHMNDTSRQFGAFLSGRVTHQLMADYWPTADQAPDASAIEAEFAEIWREKPKFVYSRTLEHADWNTTIVRDVVPEEVRRLKEQPSGDLALSGAGLAAAFLRHDLVDEFRVYVHPVLVGDGTRLFPHASTYTALRLAESRTFGNGVVLVRYERPPLASSTAEQSG
ncbi:dihydrofolate reductase family protein [Streptomyces griseus]|uniref:dihydrofolate reductase family protein n=1 Tax=Streptomyces griseus TaxID=1911 RepID=UPI00056350C6|nr:dihydrofolate reductase family protein [Streptomyces griseus]